MNTVFDPAMLFISEAEWADPQKRDAFLLHLLDHLRWIDYLRCTAIYWTDELEQWLWDSPKSPPWRQDRDWRLQIVPTIYKLFASLIVRIADMPSITSCSVAPDMIPVKARESTYEAFKHLMHLLVHRAERVHLCAGIANRLEPSGRYCFACSCKPASMSLAPLNTPEDWLRAVDWVSILWPHGTTQADHQQLRHAIEIAAGWRPSQQRLPFHSAYAFTPRFVAAAAEERTLRVELISSIAKRLRMTQNEAGHDGALKDKAVEGNAGVRRFRVSLSARIHYEYPGEASILFTDYYPPGKHDAGI